MKQLKPNHLLHTIILSLLLSATLGVSACSSEKEDTNAQSGDATGVNQSGESDASLQSGAPLPENDSNIGAGEGAGTSANNGMNTADSSGSADTSGNSMTDNNTNNDTDENPNLDQTSADGVQ